jgi:V8-like Glu-specific endopeptidase
MPDSSCEKRKENIIGTGTLLTNRLVLTCAHVVFNKEQNHKRNNLRFRLEN